MTDYGPVFVHSLWRSGSTYIFSKFRALHDFYCYQEPVHETLLFAVNDPEKLLSRESFSVYFNHPKLKKPYFFESFEQHDHWKSIISKEMIYDQYFDQVVSPELAEFYQSLITAAPCRVMVQECRTSARVGAIKRAVGGIHIHLWRRPWGQWWSFLKDRYFALVIILILNARYAPPVLQALREELGIPNFHSHKIQEEFDFYDEFQLSSRNHYKVFFAIWCLSFLEGQQSAAFDIEINKLANDIKYRNEIIEKFSNFGISNINFDDCFIQDHNFSQEERDFYIDTEKEVFQLFTDNGFSVDDVALLEQAAKVHVTTDDSKLSYPAELRETGRTILDIGSARVVRLQQELHRHTERYDHDMAAMRASMKANLDVERQVTHTVQEQLDAAEAAQDAQELNSRRALADVNEKLADARQLLISAMQDASKEAVRFSDKHQAEVTLLYTQLLGEKEGMLALLRDRQAFEAELRREVREQDAELAMLKVEMAEQGAARATLAKNEEHYRKALILLEEQLKAVECTHRLQERQSIQTINGLEQKLAALEADHARELEDLRSDILATNDMVAIVEQEKADIIFELNLEREALAALEADHSRELEDLRSDILATNAKVAIVEQEKAGIISQLNLEREALAALEADHARELEDLRSDILAINAKVAIVEQEKAGIISQLNLEREALAALEADHSRELEDLRSDILATNDMVAIVEQEKADIIFELNLEREALAALEADHSRELEDLRSDILATNAKVAIVEQEKAGIISQLNLEREALAALEADHARELEDLRSDILAINAKVAIVEQEKAGIISQLNLEREALAALEADHSRELEDLRSDILATNAKVAIIEREKAGIISQLNLEREALAALEADHARELEDLRSDILATNAKVAIVEQEKAGIISQFDLERHAIAAEQVANNAVFAAHQAKFESERTSLQQKLDDMKINYESIDQELQGALQIIDHVWRSRLPAFIKHRILRTDLRQSNDRHAILFDSEINSGGSNYVSYEISGKEDVMVKIEKNALHSLPDLLALDDVHFVHSAYLTLLGRAPDREGGNHYVAQLRLGCRKIDVLKQLRRSEEGQAYDAPVLGLSKAIRLAGLARFPIVGILFRRLAKIEGNSLPERRLRIISNSLGIVKQDVAQVSSVIQQDILDIRNQMHENVIEMQSKMRNIQQELGLIASTQAEMAASNQKLQEANQSFQATVLAAVTPAEGSSRVLPARTNVRGPSEPGIMERFFAETVWKI